MIKAHANQQAFVARLETSQYLISRLCRCYIDSNRANERHPGVGMLTAASLDRFIVLQARRNRSQLLLSHNVIVSV